jgi:hypothetical protein
MIRPVIQGGLFRGEKRSQRRDVIGFAETLAKACLDP